MALTGLEIISNQIQAAEVLIQSGASDLERKVYKNVVQLINLLIINLLR